MKSGYVEQFKDSENPNLSAHIEEIVFDLIQRRKNGEFLEKNTGAQDWGGYFYVSDTLFKITGLDYETVWQVVDKMVDDKKIDLEGAVVRDWREPPPPVWNEYMSRTKDGYTAVAYLPTHSRMEQSWAFELVDSQGNRLDPELGPVLLHEPIFGPDIDDVDNIEEVLEEILNSAKRALPSKKPPLQIAAKQEEKTEE